MRRFFKNLGVLGIALALSAPLLLSDAHAQDDRRRVLRARDVDAADVSAEYAELAMQKRIESIEFLKDLLSRGDAEGDRKAEMMLRLADLYFQQGRHLYLMEMKGFDEEYEKCFNTEGCALEALQPDNENSAEWQGKSIKLYERILQNYPRYARADEATFYLGAALSDLGRSDDAVKEFTKLVKLYPDSPYVPDAFVNIGEYYFENNNAYKALLAYKKATAYRDSDKYAFSMYKLGWCYYNVGEYGKAITTMKSVVSYSMSASESPGASRLQLQEEALKDLVRFFADAGQLDEAYEYFNKLGKKELIRSMLKRLAATYFEQGKWEEAVQTYRRLISEDPQNADNPDYQHEIVQAYQKMGNDEATFTEIDRMLKTYGKNSAWARANASDQDALRGALEKIERDLLQVATSHHERARKVRADEAKKSYAMAAKAYAVYLEEFPDSTHSYDVRYQYAELLYKVKKYDEAYVQYMAVVQTDPKGKHSRFCAESAIFAADEIVKDEQAASPTPESADKTTPIDLTDWEKKLVDACAQYASLYPDDEKVRNIIYKSAYLLYHKHRFAEAAEQFKVVIQMDPSSAEAEKAAHLILDSFVVTEDWNNLKTNSKFYYDQEGLGSRTFKREVLEIYEKASLKVIEVNFEKTKDHGATADAYLAFYEEFPESEEIARILNNSAIYYRTDDRVGDSMRVRHILVEGPEFGDKTKYYYDQIGALGYDYETVADFDKAAFYYEKLFALYPEHRKKKAKDAPDDTEALTALDSAAADALYSAAVFRKAQQDWQTAISNYKQFVATFSSDDRVLDVRLTIGKTYEDQEKWADAAGVYYSFYTDADESTPIEFAYFARSRYAKALEKQGQTSKAKKVYEETIALYAKYVEGGGEPGAHTEFVAEMMYILAEPTLEAYLEKKIVGCGCTSRKKEDEKLSETLKGKATALVEVEKAFAEIIRTGAGEWGLAALVALGKAYENMGESLSTSALPFYLTEDQVEIYKMALEDKVYPQTEKAVAAYTSALGKSYELTLYNDNTAYATRRLGVLRPDDFPGLEEEIVPPNETSKSKRTFDYATEL